MEEKYGFQDMYSGSFYDYDSLEEMWEFWSRDCYANTDATLVKRNMSCHDSKSPFLLGGNQTGDVIHDAVQKSWIDRQMRLEL